MRERKRDMKRGVKTSEQMRNVKIGGWTNEEHARFLCALGKYGKDYDKLTAYV